MGNKARNKYKLKLWVRVVIFTIFVFLMALSSFLIYTGRHPSKKNLIKYNYNINEKLGYKVYLKENDFYEEEYLEEDKQYATEIIDYIDINFEYNYSGSSLINTNYSYDISATIIGEYENTDNGNAELWKKNYTLVDTENLTSNNSTSFNINKNLKIDYNKYSKVVEKFKSKFKIPIDAYLDIKLNIRYNNSLLDDTNLISDADIMEIKIPLDKTTIKIEKNIEESRSKKLDESSLLIPNKKRIKIGLTINLLSLVIFLLLSPKIFISKKTYYVKTLNKLLKEYAEIIVEVKEPPIIDNIEIIDIKTFDDMVDIEEEIKSPILFYIVKENEESLFIIITDKYAYRYELRE